MPPKRKANAIAKDASKQTFYVLKSHYQDDDYKAVGSASEVVAIYANKTPAQIAAILPNLEEHFIEFFDDDSSLRENLKAVSPTLEKHLTQSSRNDERIPTKIDDYAKVIEEMPAAKIAAIYKEVVQFVSSREPEFTCNPGGTMYDVTASEVVY